MEYTQLSPLEVRDLINKYKSDLRKLDFQRLKTGSIIKELEGYATEIEEALSIEEATIRELPSSGEPQTEEKKAPAKRRTRPAKAEAKKPKAKKQTATKAAAKKEEAPKPEQKQETTQTAAKKEEAPKPEQKQETTQTAAKKEEAPKPEKKKKRRGRPPGSKNKTKSKSTAKGKGKTKQKAAASSTKSATEAGQRGYRLSEWDQFVLNSLEDKQKALTTSEFTEIGVANPSIKSGAAQIKTKLNRSLHKLANKKGVLVKVEHSGRGFAYALQDWLDSKGQLPKKYAKEN